MRTSIKPRAFALLVLGAASCERPPARIPSTRESAVVAAAPVVQAETASGVAPPDTMHAAPMSAIREACGAFKEILAATATASGVPHAEIVVSGDTTMNFDGTWKGPVEPACQVVWESSDSTAAPLEGVFERAKTGGWTERGRLLMADGPDGSVLAFSRRDVACLVSGSWDGGDDSDSTYVPSPGFQIAASCYSNRPDQY